MKLESIAKPLQTPRRVCSGTNPSKCLKGWMVTVLLCIVGLWVSGLRAQQASPPAGSPEPLPPGPLLERAPEFSQWTITSKGVPSPNAQTNPAASASGQKPPAASADTTTTVVKTKDIRYIQILLAGGTKIQKWCFSDMQLMLRGRGSPMVSLANGTHTPDFVDYSKSDFANFEWISTGNYTGTAKVSGQDCLIFKDMVKLDAENPPVSVVACIVKDSRLPVALQLGDEVRTYQFGQPPTEMLVPPPDIAKSAERWRKSIREVGLPPAKP